MIEGYQGRPVGTHPPPRQCGCDRSMQTCRHDFERVGPTLGPDLPVWNVKVGRRTIKIPAQSQAVAESIARHRTRNGKFDSTFLFTARLPKASL